MKKQVYVKDLKEKLEQRITEPFFIKKVTPVINGKTYYKVMLTDSTGEVDCRIWQDYIKPEYLQLGEKVALVEGVVSNYQGATQITIEKISPLDKYDPTDFSPKASNIKEMQQELKELVKGIEKEHYRKLLDHFFNDKSIFCAYSKRQAATEIHHAYIGGLLAHSLNVAKICKDIVERYNYQFHEGFDKDLLIVAAILHDIGKLKEYTNFPINKKTTTGRLVGHVAYGVAIVYATIRELKLDFSDDEMDKLLHCLLTHHGTVDKYIGNMITEAVILSRADEMDARIDAFESAIAKDDRDDDFTNYNRAMDTYIFKR